MASDASFLQSILQAVSINPSEITIERVTDARGTLLRIHVSKTDMPRIIGKQGQAIAALRLLMKLYAKDGPKISLLLDEPQH